MSYTIEYNRKIYKGENDWHSEVYYLLIRQGSSNVFDANGKRSKEWDLVAFGSESQVIQEVCSRAGSTEGGGLQRRGNNDFTPENYLELYRTKIRNAKPLEELFNEFTVTGVIHLRNEDDSFGFAWNEAQDILKNHRGEWKNARNLLKDYPRAYSKTIKDKEEFKKFLRLPSYSSRNDKDDAFRTLHIV